MEKWYWRYDSGVDPVRPVCLTLNGEGMQSTSVDLTVGDLTDLINDLTYARKLALGHDA